LRLCFAIGFLLAHGFSAGESASTFGGIVPGNGQTKSQNLKPKIQREKLSHQQREKQPEDVLENGRSGLGGSTRAAGTGPEGAAIRSDHLPHGLVWNTALPGVAGELLITFDVRAVIGGTGLGAFADAVHPGINSHVGFNLAIRQNHVYTLQGTVSRSNDAANVGRAVTVVAEVFGDETIAHIQIGDLTFMGSGL